MAKKTAKIVGGVARPAVTTGPADPVRARIARKAVGAGFGMTARSREAGMLVDVMQPAAPYVSGYKLNTYRSSYAYGLGDRTGAYDIPQYFVMMNEQNGGMLYWPVTLAEKYSWYRYWVRTDAYIGRGMELLADLPMSKLTLNMPKMKDKKLQAEILEFFEYQMEVLNLFEMCQSILWEMNMIGNCFKGDTSIVTSSGVVPMSEVREGDMVLDADGSFSRVSAVARRRVDERLVSLGIAKLSGMEFAPTSEHPVWVLRGDGEEMVKVGDVRRGDWIGMGFVGEDKDRESVGWMEEMLEGYLPSFYESAKNRGNEVVCRYSVPTGVNVGASEVRDALLSWVGGLKESTTADCAEVAGIIGIADAVRVRSVAYSMRKAGEIRAERTSKGRRGGSSMVWYPGASRKEDGHSRDMDIVFSGVARGVFDVDEDLMYLLGYWLGDGWLWRSKSRYAKEFEGWDICVSKECPELLGRVDTAARSVFGDGAVDNEPFIEDDGMAHVVVRDSLMAAWWNTQFGSDCGSKKIPDWVMSLPEEKVLWLLRGLVDSDGFVSRKESGCLAGVTGTNKGLMLQVFHLMLKCGIPASFVKSEQRRVVLPNGDEKDCSGFAVLVGTRGHYEKLVCGCHKEMDAEWSENEVVNPAFKEKDGRFYYRVDRVDRPFFGGFVYNFEVEGSHTYCANGVRTHNCYIFHEWDEKKKMWSRAVMLPPEEVYVFQYPFSESKRVEYRPLRLIGMIKSGQFAEPVAAPQGDCDRSSMTAEIVKHMPRELVEMVEKEGCIVMDSDPTTGSFVHHIARRRSPYEDLGASVLERVLVPMLQKEHYRYTQLSLASRNMTPKNVISAQGLMPDELDELRTQVDLSYMDPEYSVITNYEVNWEQIGVQERFLDFGREYETIENQVFAAMGTTRELLTGEGAYSGNKITVEILNTMFLLTREVLKNYIEKQLFIPVCKKRGWVEKGKNGVEKYLYPKVGFNRLTIRDNAEVFESLFQLYQKGSLPVDIMYELFNLNAEEMHNKIKADLFTVKDSTFNRAVEEMNTEMGRALVKQSNVVQKVAKYLGLEYHEEQQGGEGGLGGGMGGGLEDAAAEAMGQGAEGEAQPDEEGEPEKEEARVEGDGEPDVEEKAKEIADALPEGATDEDIDKALEGKGGEEEKPK
jgi:intein/homing endonuclease